MELVDGELVAMQGREVVPSRPERNHASALQGALLPKRKGTGDIKIVPSTPVDARAMPRW